MAMTIGQIARRVLGDRWFPVAGAWYRALAVDLEKVASEMPIPRAGEVILDVGGGDGALLDRYLARHSTAKATMVDLNATIGISLSASSRQRVELLPGTSILQYAQLGRPVPSLVLVSDVIHHVPQSDRLRFFGDIKDLLAGNRARLVVKDVQPGSLRAAWCWASDRFISGDRNVKLIGVAEMVQLVRCAFPGAAYEETPLIHCDSPNYCLVFSV
jgi:hypothetical protein